MSIPTLSTSSHDYVVLDVETNGLRCKEHDLLSISIYKPDDGLEFDRFLPLDLNQDVYTTAINGITKRKIKNKKHLTQDEVNMLFENFELDNRIILHYGNLDERFIREYFKRHNLVGYERMHFFNFKRMICSSKFSDGSLTKDRLCTAFGIDGVTQLHTGMNDCKLEWKLFQAFDGHYVLATMRSFTWQFTLLSSEYIVPVSYLSTYPNLSRLYDRPYICFEQKEIYRYHIADEDIKRFKSNFSGTTIEWLITSMLSAKREDNKDFLHENFAKNQPIGYMFHDTYPVFMTFNPDGTVTAVNEHDKAQEAEINETLLAIKKQIDPLIQFIRMNIFNNKEIISQELTVNNDMNILALCDLSTADAVLEIKTTAKFPELYAEQLFYESKGRKTYLLLMDWQRDWTTGSKEVDFIITEVNVFPGDKPNKRRDKTIATLNSELQNEDIEVTKYINSTTPVTVQCKQCKHEWTETYARIKSNRCVCPICHPDRVVPYIKRSTPKEPKQQKRQKLTQEQSREIRAHKYAEKVAERSSNALIVDTSSYTRAKEPVTVCCSCCGHTWTKRADHLLAFAYCPQCSAGRNETSK